MTVSEVLKKPHYFEVVMNSTSEIEEGDVEGFPAGTYLNQEVLVREYAFTPAELTAKQMPFTKKVIPSITDAFDELSMPLQQQGMMEMAEALEKDNAKRGKGKPAATPAPEAPYQEVR